MDGEDDCAHVSLSAINAPFAEETLEVQESNRLMECAVPDLACLLHAVDAFNKTHDPVLLPRGCEARGLFHEDSLRLRKDAMKESRLNVDVLNVPVEYGSNVKQGAKRF